MQKFYFTFSNNPNFPYQDGYIIIRSDNYWKARKIFQDKYGVVNGVLPFSLQYSQQEWEENKDHLKKYYTNAYIDYMLGKCHEEIGG